jgi:hypothetical protein
MVIKGQIIKTRVIEEIGTMIIVDTNLPDQVKGHHQYLPHEMVRADDHLLFRLVEDPHL